MRTDTAPLPPLWEYTDEFPARIESKLLKLCRPESGREPVLIVGRETKRLSRAIEARDHAVTRCAGSHENCPLLRNERCKLRDEAGAIVLRVAPFDDEQSHPAYRLCSAEGDTPCLIVLEGRAHPLTRHGHVARIGGMRGSSGAAAAVERLLEVTSL
jgi:hypothetical protein